MPYHALRTDDWRALPKEKDIFHGCLIGANLLMAFKFREASSSDCPPERKVIPGTAGVMVLERVLTV